MEQNGMEPQSYTIMGNHRFEMYFKSMVAHRFETYGVGSKSVTSVNTYKYILLMYQKNVCLKRTKKKVSYFIKCTSFNDVLRSVFIYFLP